jgi:hypothetical protein
MEKSNIAVHFLIYHKAKKKNRDKQGTTTGVVTQFECYDSVDCQMLLGINTLHLTV